MHNKPKSALNGCEYLDEAFIKRKIEHCFVKQLPCFPIDHLLNPAQQRAFKSENPGKFE